MPWLAADRSKPPAPISVKPFSPRWRNWNAGLGGQGGEALAEPLDLERQAPLRRGGGLVGAVMLGGGAEDQAALGVDPVMRVAGGRGEQAGAENRAAIDREPSGIGGAARQRVLVDAAVEITAGDPEIDIVGDRPVEPGEEAAGAAGEAG